jgi:hypothetical protein
MVKVDPGTLSGPKHVKIRSGSPGLRGMKMGSNMLVEPKHVGLGAHSRA